MYSKLYSCLITFPLEQLGWGLRKLSLSGAAGNVLAIVIYILICFIPCLLYFRLKKSGRLLKIDVFLPILSALLLIVIYYMINPGLFNAGVQGVGKFLLGSVFYSVFWGYIILRILDKCRFADTQHLQTGLKGLLAVVIVLLVYTIFSECFENFSVFIQKLQTENNSPDADLTVTYIFLVLQCITTVIPYALDIFILFTAIHALDELLIDRYSDASVAAAGKLAGLCTKSLAISVLSGMIFNVLQLLFHSALYQINMVVSIPVFSIAFVLAILLTAKYVCENQKLKRDNDLFI